MGSFFPNQRLLKGKCMDICVRVMGRGGEERLSNGKRQIPWKNGMFEGGFGGVLRI